MIPKHPWGCPLGHGGLTQSQRFIRKNAREDTLADRQLARDLTLSAVAGEEADAGNRYAGKYQHQAAKESDDAAAD